VVNGERTDLPLIGARLGQTDDAKMLNIGQRSVERAVAVPEPPGRRRTGRPGDGEGRSEEVWCGKQR
jgi:hypothetical protein